MQKTYEKVQFSYHFWGLVGIKPAFEVCVTVKLNTACSEKEASRNIEVLYVASLTQSFQIANTVKPVLSSHSKMDETKVLKTNCRLVKVESVAEFPFGAFCNTFDLH